MGAGAIARDHAEALARIPDVQINYVFSGQPERARGLAGFIGGAAWTTDPAVIFNSPDIDAVDICDATARHAPLTIEAARHGKPVLVEKPAALTLADFDAMTAAAHENKVSLMVGQTTRFHPVHLELKAAITAGTIGRLRLLHTTWYAGYMWPNGWRSWQLDPVRSGGHPIHNGVHPLDLATWLIGQRPVRVFARGISTWASTMPTPDSFHVTARFEDGSLALMEFYYSLPARGDYLRRILAVGEKGSLQHNTEKEARLRSDAANPPSPAVQDAMYRQLSHWVATLRGTEEPIVKLEEVRAALAAGIAAQESLQTGRAVTLVPPVIEGAYHA
jgi:predicted dehydrogenase